MQHLAQIQISRNRCVRPSLRFRICLSTRQKSTGRRTRAARGAAARAHWCVKIGTLWVESSVIADLEAFTLQKDEQADANDCRSVWFDKAVEH
jgi:hypothetical protein